MNQKQISESLEALSNHFQKTKNNLELEKYKDYLVGLNQVELLDELRKAMTESYQSKQDEVARAMGVESRDITTEQKFRIVNVLSKSKNLPCCKLIDYCTELKQQILNTRGLLDRWNNQ